MKEVVSRPDLGIPETGGARDSNGVSTELQAIVGEPALPRTEIVKQLWAYIRKNNLQDPSNKRKIICDDALRLVFETDCTDMFKMNKQLAKHIIPLEPTKESGQAIRLKVDVEPATESTEPGPMPVIISEALAKSFGTGEREMLQSEALRRVWDYIKVNHLEDPLNSMAILTGMPRGNEVASTHEEVKIEQELQNNSGAMTTGRASNLQPDTYEASIETAHRFAPKRGMILEFKPLSMSFDSVNYYVDMPPEMKEQGITENNRLCDHKHKEQSCE
ncbi:hypothetical protein F0562_011630 [Nyssa sinensis]|uniref:DM2 domain-containing protein n=1 Tax=Nyssa sinensis TaxID=561372 RepID=A0A5J4ZV05_9ASTE|nr:hypothetical protein F0562_011630 [Nyssa sinensis]